MPHRAPVFAAVLLAAGTFAAAGCAVHQNPTELRDWPVTLVPASDDPGRLVALPPDCDAAALPPPRDDVGGWHNPDLNLGCSSARNLATMVAQPRDLLVGRDPGPEDGQRGAAATRRYRLGQEKPLVREQAGTLRVVAPGSNAPTAGGEPGTGAQGGQ